MRRDLLRVGDVYRVKDAVWREWCIRHQKDHSPFKPQPITDLPTNPPFCDYVMLAFPFYWWKPEELEPAV